MAHHPNPAEEMAAKAMGVAKKGKAALEGLTGIFRTLVQEHGEVTVLLLRLEGSDDPQLRAELFPQVRRELLAHEESEVNVLYPALREYPETQLIADVHDREVTQLHQVLEVLSNMSYSDPSWPEHFDALVKLVQKHVEEEEGQFFPNGQRVLGERTESLRTQYESMKKASTNLL